jgi:hypothetical protein
MMPASPVGRAIARSAGTASNADFFSGILNGVLFSTDNLDALLSDIDQRTNVTPPRNAPDEDQMLLLLYLLLAIIETV